MMDAAENRSSPIPSLDNATLAALLEDLKKAQLRVFEMTDSMQIREELSDMDKDTADAITIIEKQLAEVSQRLSSAETRLIKACALLDEQHRKITGLISTAVAKGWL
jgi:hypothetical protein